MSLRKYLEDNKIDQIEDDQEFEEVEYTAIQTYCESESCGYNLGSDDVVIIKERGLENSFDFWKDNYVHDLWEEFGEVPMNLEIENLALV